MRSSPPCRLYYNDYKVSPFSIGAGSLSAEAARLIIPHLTGGSTVETLTAGNFYSARDYPTIAAINDGRRRHLLIVNDGNNGTDASTVLPSKAYTATFNLSAWGMAPATTLVLSTAGASSFGEVTSYLQVPASGVISMPLPAYTVARLSAPIGSMLETNVSASEDTQVNAGASKGLPAATQVGALLLAQDLRCSACCAHA